MNDLLNANDLIKAGERIDDLECNGFCIIQNPSYFCFGMDAVLLSGFVNAGKKSKTIDLGTGTGIIPLLLTAKDKVSDVTGLEIQAEVADMASRSVELNKASDRCHIVQGDIKEIRQLYEHQSFDIVTSNPPYISDSKGLMNPNTSVNIARHEVLVSLEEVISAAAYLLKNGGSFNMVHKPFRIPEIMQLMMKYKLEPKRMQLVQPYCDKEPNMVLIESIKAANPGCRILPSLIIYNKDGTYTREVLSIYGKIGE